MTNGTNALALRDAPHNALDIEAQHTEAPQYNRTLARAKIATLAAASIAGALTTALVTLHEGSEPSGLHDRSLLEHECSPHQSQSISKNKRALVISGATAGACFGGALLGGCLMRMCSETGEESMNLGWMMRKVCATGFGLSATATVISGIMYGKAKGKC